MESAAKPPTLAAAPQPAASAAHLATRPTTATDSSATALLDLPPDVRALIISKTKENAERFRALPAEYMHHAAHKAARTLASTTSAALEAVLEARTDIRTFTVHRALARSIAHLRFSAASNPRTSAELWCSQGEVLIRVYLPLHALPLACAEQQHADAHTPANPAHFWLSPAAIASATRVHASAPSLTPLSLPPGMAALAELKVECCTLPAGWLPLSSRGSVRTHRTLAR
jgi:hypothetical protein